MTEQEAQDKLRQLRPEQLGRLGEDIWKNVLCESGYQYVPLARIEDGGAPMARSKDGVTILPDYQAWSEGKAVFLEAKAKTQSIVFREKSQERHGIDEHNYIHYIRAAQQSSLPCAIGLVELWREDVERRNALYWSGSLLLETLKDLGDPRQEYRETPPKVYWRRKQFRDLDSFKPLELYALARGTLKRSYKFELDRIFMPFLQTTMFEV